MSSWGTEKDEYTVPRPERGRLSVKSVLYGRTVLGAPLTAFLPGQWASARTLVLAGIHGEEPETTNALSYALRTLNPAYLRCAVILCANPDGLAHGMRGNIRNVDLNRNFPTSDWSNETTTTRWEMDLPQDVRLSSGDAPASEPEVQGLIEFIEQNQFKQIISIHAPMACVDYEQPEHWALVEALSTRLNLPIVNDIGYPCPGSMDTWASAEGIKLLTLEIEDDVSLSEIRKKYGTVFIDLLRGELEGL